MKMFSVCPSRPKIGKKKRKQGGEGGLGEGEWGILGGWGEIWGGRGLLYLPLDQR